MGSGSSKHSKPSTRYKGRNGSFINGPPISFEDHEAFTHWAEREFGGRGGVSEMTLQKIKAGELEFGGWMKIPGRGRPRYSLMMENRGMGMYGGGDWLSGSRPKGGRWGGMGMGGFGQGQGGGGFGGGGFGSHHSQGAGTGGNFFGQQSQQGNRGAGPQHDFGPGGATVLPDNETVDGYETDDPLFFEHLNRKKAKEQASQPRTRRQSAGSDESDYGGVRSGGRGRGNQFRGNWRGNPLDGWGRENLAAPRGARRSRVNDMPETVYDDGPRSGRGRRSGRHADGGSYRR